MSDFTKITNTTSISFEELAAEHGVSSANGSISLSDYYKGGNRVASTTDNSTVPTSGSINLQNFLGSSGYYPGQIYASGNNITANDKFAIYESVNATGVYNALPGISGVIPASSIKTGYTFSTITNSRGGRTGLTLQTRIGDQFSGYWKYNLPFTINFLGRTINTVYVSATSTVYFRNSSWTSDVYELSNDIYPPNSATENAMGDIYSTKGLGISICNPQYGYNASTGETNSSGQYIQNSAQKLYAGVSGTTPNRTVRFRYEGTSNEQGIGGEGVIVSYTSATLTYVAPSSSGLTSSSTPQLGNNDDGAWQLTVPWSVKIGDVTSSTIFASTNFFVTTNSEIATNISLAGGPAILFGNGDRIVNSIAYGTSGTAPNRTYKIYFDGFDDLSSGNVFRAMVIFYENDLNRIDVHMNTSTANTIISDGQYTIYALGSSGQGLGSVTTNNNPATNAGYRLTRSEAAATSNNIWEMILYEAAANIDVHLGINPKFSYNSQYTNLIVHDEFDSYNMLVDEPTGTRNYENIRSGVPSLYDANKGVLTGLNSPQISKFTAQNTSRRITTTAAVSRTTGGIINTPTLSGNLQVGTTTIVPNAGTIYGSSGSYTLSTSFATSNSLNDVVENGADVYVAVGNGGTWLSGSNGFSWSTRTSGTTQNLNAVTHGTGGGAEYVAVGNAGTIVGGTSFASPAVRTSGTTNNLFGVTYGNTDDLFVAVGASGTILTSPDGTTWTSRTSGTANRLSGVCYSTTSSIATTAASGTGTTATLTFAARSVAPYTVGQSIVVAGVTPTGYNGTFTVTACTTTTVSYANTTTGAQTVAGTIRPAALDLFVAVGDGGVILTSPDGVTWTSRTSGTTQALYDVAWGSEVQRFVAVGANGTVLSSSNGTTWAAETSGTANTLWRVAYGPSRRQFAACGNSNTIIYSNDGGDTWATATAVTTGAAINGIHYGVKDNRFVAVSSINQAYATISDYVAAPFTVGESITVAGVTPAGYNGTYTVLGVSSTAIAWANNTTTVATVQGNIKPTTNPKWNKVVKSGGTTYALRDNGQVWYWGVNPNVPVYMDRANSTEYLTASDRSLNYSNDFLQITGSSGTSTTPYYESQPLISSIYARPVSTTVFKDICNLDSTSTVVGNSVNEGETRVILIGNDNKVYPIGNLWTKRAWTDIAHVGFPKDLLTINEYVPSYPTFSYTGLTGLTAATYPSDGTVTTLTLPFTTTIGTTTGNTISIGYNGMILLGNGSNYPTDQYIVSMWGPTVTNFVLPAGTNSVLNSLLYTGSSGTTPNRTYRILFMVLNGGGYNDWLGNNNTQVTGVNTSTNYITLSQDPMVYFSHEYGENMVGCAIKFATSFCGITAGTIYYVVNVATNSIQVSTTYGGTAVDLTGTYPGGSINFEAYDKIHEVIFYENGNTTYANGTVRVNIAKASWAGNGGYLYAYSPTVYYSADAFYKGTSILWQPSGVVETIPTNFEDNFKIPPTSPATLSADNVKYAIAGEYDIGLDNGSYYYAIKTDGSIAWFGKHTYYDFFSGTGFSVVESKTTSIFNNQYNWKHISCKNGLFCGITTTNDAYMWGAQGYGYSTGGGKGGSSYYYVSRYLYGNPDVTSYNVYDSVVPVSGGHKFKQICIGIAEQSDVCDVVFGIKTNGSVLVWGWDSQRYSQVPVDPAVPAPLHYEDGISEFLSNGNIKLIKTKAYNVYEGMPIRFTAAGPSNQNFFSTTGLMINKIYYVKTYDEPTQTITISETRYGSTILPLNQVTSIGAIANYEYGLIDCRIMTEMDTIRYNNSSPEVGLVITARDGCQYSFGSDAGWGILTDEIGYNRLATVYNPKPAQTNQQVRFSKVHNGTKYIIK